MYRQGVSVVSAATEKDHLKRKSVAMQSVEKKGKHAPQGAEIHEFNPC